MVHRYTKLSTSIGCGIDIKYSRNCCMLQVIMVPSFIKQLLKISIDYVINVERPVVWHTKVVMN